MAYKHRIYDTNQGGFKAAWRYSVHKVFGNSHLDDDSYKYDQQQPSKQDFPILVESTGGGESLHSSIGIQEFFNPFNYIEFLFTLVHAGVDELTKWAFLKEQYDEYTSGNVIRTVKDLPEYKALDDALKQASSQQSNQDGQNPVTSVSQEHREEQQPLVQDRQALVD